MKRNAETRFGSNPTRMDMSRSTFNRPHSHKTSFNVGDVIPFYVDEVLPGDTHNIKTSKVVRMQSLITPVMDNIYLDTYYFFVPNRLVWDHWKEFNGENTQSAWIPEVEYEVPQLASGIVIGEDEEEEYFSWESGSIADYMGIPPGVQQISVNALPFRAYALIMNEWFRDENLSDPLHIPKGDATEYGSNGDDYVTDVVKGGKPFKAAKFRDYFTSCLPAPQKGPDVTIPVAEVGAYPVIPSATRNDASLFVNPYTSISDVSGTAGTGGIEFAYQAGSTEGTQSFDQTGQTNRNRKSWIDNLVAVTDGFGSMASINQLRMAFQIQKLYERDARGGTRYIEILKSHFGVTSPDYRLQRPEYLGGNRVPITINQVLQQSETSEVSPQGTPTGQSLTTDVHGDFVKSFVEHGFIIGVMVARYDHTYQQGLERFWSRKDRFDYYWPVFANIGEQAVLNKEIFIQGDAVEGLDDEVFGYQEAWADYRYKPSRVSGEMRSVYAQSLDVWHLSDYYEIMPVLSDEWIREDSATVDRVIAVSEQEANQLFCDLYVQNKTTRPMPMYSVPGLIDHH